LKKLGYVSRSQLQIIHEFTSVRNTQHILKGLAPYVSTFREGETIYYLNAEGRKVTGDKKVRKKLTTAMHYTMRNYVYIAYGQPKDWKNETRLKYKDVNIIADALFQMDGSMYVVEVDHTQTMQENQKKIAKYKKLLEYNALKSDTFFVWITTTAYRKEALEKLTDGMNAHVFTVSDFQ